MRSRTGTSAAEEEIGRVEDPVAVVETRGLAGRQVALGVVQLHLSEGQAEAHITRVLAKLQRATACMW
jgi:hypothetical protein